MKTIIWSDKNATFYEELFLLVLPIVFQQLMLAAVSASDALMLGFVNWDSLSAVSLARRVTFVFNPFMGDLTMGTSILAAQYHRKGDMISIEKIFVYVIRVSLLISVTSFLVTLFIPEALMRIFMNEPQLISSGIVYPRVTMPPYLFTNISQIYLCTLKNIGYAIKSMVIGSTIVVINISLNATLIYGLLFFPETRIAGAALAISIPKSVETGWAYLESLREKRAGSHIRYCFTTEKNLMWDYWKYTVSILGDYLVWGYGFTTYSVIMGHLGSDVTAASSIANIVKDLTASLYTGFGNDGGIIVGNELGMGNLKQAKGYGGRLCRFTIINDVLSGVFLVAPTPIIVEVTTLSPQATGYLKWILILCACYMVRKSANIATIAEIFPAGGDSKFGLIRGAVTMWAFIVPAGFLAVSVWDLPVVIVSLIINPGEIVKLPAATLHYRKHGWLKNLTRQKRDQNK